MLALFLSGGQTDIWRQYQRWGFFSVLLPAPLLPGKRLQD